MFRRWYVSVVILAAAVGLTGALLNLGSLYTTTTVVSFTLPSTSALQPDNGTADASVIDFASSVANEANSGQSSPQYASVDAPFYGAGVRKGITVRLPNYGGQWAPTSFMSALIEIQIVGPDPTWVRAQQTAVLERIRSRAHEQQSTAPRSRRITATVEPLTTQIVQIAPSNRDKLIGVASMGLAVLISSAWLSAAVDRVARHRQPRAARGRSRSGLATSVVS